MMYFAFGAVQWLATDVATTNYTVTCTDVATGVQFQPKAIRFYWVGLGSASDTASATVSERRGLGFAASATDRRCVGMLDTDNAANSSCGAVCRNDAIAATCTGAAATDGLLDVSAISATGFTLTVDDAAPVNITVFWEAWGSDDNAMFAATGEIAEPGATGAVNYECGFTPSVVMFASSQNVTASNVSNNTHSGFSIGFSTGPETGENVVVFGGAESSAPNSDTDGYCQTGEVACQIPTTGGNPSMRVKLSALLDRGFTLNWLERASTRRVIYLAISGGCWQAGALTIDGNSANATTRVAGLPFKPLGILLMGCMTAQDTNDATHVEDLLTLGTGATTASRQSMGCRSRDSVGTMEIDLAIEYDQVMAYPDTAGGVLTAYDINSMLADGFELIVDVGGGVANEWVGYLTFGSKNPLQLNNYLSPTCRNSSGMSTTEKIR